MKKTLTINLGGIVFNIDEDAFAALRSYLDTIKGYFDTSEGRDEIMTDIESRIAEMLQEKLKGSKQVINSEDINEVIAVMGQPEDYISEEMDEEPRTQSYNTYAHSRSTRRLYRDPDNSILGGVCSGIGYYFGIDPLWIRLAFVIAVFAGFSGILVYIVLWVIMPEARTAAEKLAMRGEPVTFENIGRTVEEGMDNLKKKLNNIDDKNLRRTSNQVQSGLAKFFDFIGNLLVLLFKGIGKVLGVFLIIFSSVSLVMLIVFTFFRVNNVFIDSADSTVAYSFIEFSDLIFTSSSSYWLTSIGGFLAAGVPLAAMLLGGLTLLFNVRYPRFTGLGMAGLWVLGIVLLFSGGINTGMDFGKKGEVSSVMEIERPANDTLIFELMTPKNALGYHKGRNSIMERFEIKDGVLTTDGIGVDVLKSNSQNVHLEIVRSARGKTFNVAEDRAGKINYVATQEDSLILLDPYFNFNVEDKWRNQGIKVNLYLPVNTTIYIPQNFKYLLDDVKNYTNTYDRVMVDHYWTMTDSGLVSPYFLEQEAMIEVNADKHHIKIKVDDMELLEELEQLEELEDLEMLQDIEVEVN